MRIIITEKSSKGLLKMFQNASKLIPSVYETHKQGGSLVKTYMGKSHELELFARTKQK